MSLTSAFEGSGTSIHVDGNAHASAVVDIDAGILDVDSTGVTEITAGEDLNLISSVSRYYQPFDFHSTTFENNLDSGKYSGKILKYSPGDDTTLTAGQIYYLRNNGRWYVAHADSSDGGGDGYGSYQLLGVGLGGSSQTVGVLLEGFIRVPSTEILNAPTGGATGAVDGMPLYVSTTAGHFDFTAPSDSSDFVRVAGYAIDDYSSDVLVYFNPSKTWIVLA